MLLTAAGAARAGIVEVGVVGSTTWSALGGFNQQSSNLVLFNYPGDTVTPSFNYPAWHVAVETGTTTLDVGLNSASPVALFVNTGATLTDSFAGTTQFTRSLESPTHAIDNFGIVNVTAGTLSTVTNALDSSFLNESGATLHLSGSGNLLFDQDLDNEGTIQLDGPTNSIIGGPAGGSNCCAASLENHGVINGSGNLGTNGGRIHLLFNLGTMDANGASPLGVWLDGSQENIFGPAFLNLNGSLVQVDAGSEMDITGGTFDQTGGNTKVNGTLKSDHTLKFEAGTFGGAGTFQANVVQTGGIFDVGDPQTTTIDGNYSITGGEILMHIDGTSAGDQDHIIFNGSANLSGGAIELDIPLGLNLNGLTLSLFTFNGGETGTPNFIFTNGQNYQVTRSGDLFQFSGNGNGAAATPEPGEAMLLAGGLALLWMRRRSGKSAAR